METEHKLAIPGHILYKQTLYHKVFLLALFITMGTTLFGCSDKKENKQKVHNAEALEDTAKKEHLSGGDASSNTDMRYAVPPPPPETERAKFVKPKENPIPDDNKKSPSLPVNSAKNEETNNEKKKNSKEEVYVSGEVVSTNAEFPGGIDRFYTFFGKEFKTPENANTKNIRIRISFAVEINGSLSYIESSPGIDKTTEQEIIRVLSLSPKWQPGESGGKKTRMQYSLPIVLE